MLRLSGPARVSAGRRYDSILVKREQIFSGFQGSSFDVAQWTVELALAA